MGRLGPSMKCPGGHGHATGAWPWTWTWTSDHLSEYLGQAGSWAPEMSGIRPLKLAAHARLYTLCSAVRPLSPSVGMCAVR